MRSLPAVLALASIAALFSGCQKTETAPAAPATPPPPPPTAVQVVKEQERSRHFLAVSRQLELGGTLYGYMDIDGDDRKVADTVRKLGDFLGATNPQIALFAKQDYAGIFQSLGLDDVKAVGLSSVPEGNGYFRNRLFLYTPNGRTGFLAAGGGAPGKFPHLSLATADTDLYFDSDIDATQIYSALQGVAKRVGGETAANAMEAQLKNLGQMISFSILGLFENLKGNTALLVRVSDSDTLSFPRPGKATPLVVPRFEIVGCVDGIGGIVEAALRQSSKFTADVAGPVHYYTATASPLPGLAVTFAVDGSTLYFGTSRSYLDAVLKKSDGLRQNAAFQEAFSHIAADGNGLCYISPHVYTAIGSLSRLNTDPQEAQLFSAMAMSIPTHPKAAISIRTNLPDGILIRSYTDRSQKPLLAVVTIYNPVTIGLYAAMIAQQKSAAARANAVAHPAMPPPRAVPPMSPETQVRRNLRVIYAAGLVYARQHQQAEVAFSDLVGEGKPIAAAAIPSVAGEDYSALVIAKGKPLKVTLANGTVVSYTPAVPKVAPPAAPAAVPAQP